MPRTKVSSTRLLIGQAMLWGLLIASLFVFGAMLAVLADIQWLIAPIFFFGLIAAVAVLRNPYLGLLLLLAAIPLQYLGKITEDGSVTIAKVVLPLLFLAWLAKKIGQRDRLLITNIVDHPVLVAGLLFMLATMPSFVNARDLGFAYGFLMMKLVPMFLIMVMMQDLINSRERLRGVYYTVFFISWVVGAFGNFEYFTGQSALRTLGLDYNLIAGSGGSLVASKWDTFSEGEAEWVRVGSTFLDPDFFGGYILLSMAFALGLWKLTESRWMRLLILTYLAMSALNIVGTGSRAVVLGSIAFAGLCVLVMRFPMRNLLMITLALAAMAVLPFIEELFPQFREGISLDAYYADPRYGFWTTAVAMIKAHPLVGIGLGNFIVAYPAFMTTPALHKPYLGHNIALNVLAETGVLGASFFLLFALSIYATFIWTVHRSDDPTLRYLSLVGVVSFGSFSLFALTSNTLDFEYAWVVAGLAIGLWRQSGSRVGPRGAGT